MAPDLATLFEAVGVTGTDGARFTLPYDRFVLAAGSRLFTPPIPGLAEHAFNVDQLDSAHALDAHLKALATQTETAARNTVVVAGGRPRQPSGGADQRRP